MAKTITALATPPGIGGIAVIRLSGEEAFSIADKCFEGALKLSEAKPNTFHFGCIVRDGQLLDTVIASVFHSPKSYTGEDSVEISCHGGMLVANDIVELLIENGATQAEPGEFTKRAFLNGKLDLTQVEAVADIIHSASTKGYQTAARQLAGEFTNRIKELRQKLLDACGLLELELDFSDEDIELIPKNKIMESLKEAFLYCKDLGSSFRSAEILRSGYFVAITGYPNSGKSTLFNALLQRKRAIVSELPGTTRDYLEETLLLNGLAIKIIDTAGLRTTENIIEIEGIKLVESVMEQSNLICIINDLSISPDNSNSLLKKISNNYARAKVILLQNKTDLVPPSDREILNDIQHPELKISAKKDVGIDTLKDFLYQEALHSTERIKDVLINQRHSRLLWQASRELGNAMESLKSGMENEIISIDVRAAIKTLGEVIGETWNEDILNNIFSRFCIGK